MLAVGAPPGPSPPWVGRSCRSGQSPASEPGSRIWHLVLRPAALPTARPGQRRPRPCLTRRGCRTWPWMCSALSWVRTRLPEGRVRSSPRGLRLCWQELPGAAGVRGVCLARGAGETRGAASAVQDPASQSVPRLPRGCRSLSVARRCAEPSPALTLFTPLHCVPCSCSLSPSAPAGRVGSFLYCRGVWSLARQVLYRNWRFDALRFLSSRRQCLIYHICEKQLSLRL